MCFSATASFAASGGLALVGAATLKVSPRRKRILAAIPFLFAVQQALEGIQWLALGSGTTCRIAGYGFMIFALIIWPVVIPALVYHFDRTSRKRIRWFVGVGIIVALGYAFALAVQPLGIDVVGTHIGYHLRVPFDAPLRALYLVAVIGPLWASSILAFRRYGVLVFLAALAAIAVQWLAFASVWCFFAALVSSWLYLYSVPVRSITK